MTGAPLAIVVKGYPRLSETFIAQELLELQARGYDFDIWSLRAPYDDREHPIHAEISAPRRYLAEYLYQAVGRTVRGWWRARRMRGYRQARALWLRDLRRDLTSNRVRRWGQALMLAAELPDETRFIYAHFLHTPSSVARYAATTRGIPWGFSAHAKDIWTIPDWEKREKLGDAAFGVTCTGSGAEHLKGLTPAPDRLHLVYHGLDMRRFPDPPERSPSPNRSRILSVGRLVAKKGYDDLIEAFNRLPDTLEWTFTHIGGGPMATELKSRAEALGLSDRITWLGKKDQADVIAAMRDADLFVLPSKIAEDGDRDGLPNVLMEAASQALPIVSTAVSAIPEFINDGESGVLVPPGDPDSLADGIARAASDPVRSAALAARAYSRLNRDFGMMRGIDTLDALLKQEMGG